MLSKKISILVFLSFILIFFTTGLPVEAQGVKVRENVIRVDDVVKIEVYGENDLSGEYIVNKAGQISFPLIGDVKVEGLTINQAKDLLEGKLKKYILNPQIISILRESQTQTNGNGGTQGVNVSILGAVTRPGAYPSYPDLTLMQLIASAGDFTKEADVHHVHVLHIKEDGSKEILNVDAEKILKGLSQDPLLNEGDVISVLSRNQTGGDESVTILGAVAHPGAYPSSPGMTLMQLVASAGDFIKGADTRRVNILRSNDDGSKDLLYADAGEILGGAAADIPLNDGDIVSVKENVQDNFVVLIGQVNKPGTYEYQAGMTLLGLIANAGDFTELANKTRIKIIRKQGAKSQIMVVDVRKILNGRSADIVLEPDDVVSVPETFF